MFAVSISMTLFKTISYDDKLFSDVLVKYFNGEVCKQTEKKLRPGMSVILDIETLKKDNVLKVPHEYIIKDKEGYFVFSAEGEKKEVKVGISNDSFFEVTEGISAGEQLKKIDLMSFFNGQNESQ